MCAVLTLSYRLDFCGEFLFFILEQRASAVASSSVGAAAGRCLGVEDERDKMR